MTNWEEVSFVLRGRVRIQVFRALDKPETATLLAKSLNTDRSTVSRILLRLEKEGYVHCLDVEAPYTKYYERTPKGARVARALNTRTSHTPRHRGT